jgi:hypothetical protein
VTVKRFHRLSSQRSSEGGGWNLASSLGARFSTGTIRFGRASQQLLEAVRSPFDRERVV